MQSLKYSLSVSHNHSRGTSKPLELFHGLSLDGQIENPSFKGNSTQKERRDDKSRAQRSEQLGAHHCQVFPPASAFFALNVEIHTFSQQAYV